MLFNSTADRLNLAALPGLVRMIGRSLLILLLSFGFSGSAAAQSPTARTTETIARAAGWSVYRTLPNITPGRCGVDVAHAATERYFSVNAFQGERRLLIRATKRSWSIPENTRIPVSLRVDQRTNWTASGLGSGTEIWWYFSGDSIVPFLDEFQAGLSMVVAFPGGNEPPWHFSLQGTAAMLGALVRCMAELAQRTAPSGPTQPFGRPSAPTQPFGERQGFPQVPVPDAAPADRQ